MFKIIVHRYGKEIIHSYDTFDEMLKDFFWMEESEEHFFEGVKIDGKWVSDHKKHVIGLNENEESIKVTLGNKFSFEGNVLEIDKNNDKHLDFFEKI